MSQLQIPSRAEVQAFCKTKDPYTHGVAYNDQADEYVTHAKQHPQDTEQILEAIEKAVRHIWSLPLPPNAAPGAFEREISADRFFSDVGAGKSFNNLEEVEDWINNQLEKSGKPERIALQDQELCLCHCDLSIFNIKVTEPITIIDWGFSGIYPRIFEEFALLHQFNLSGAKFAKALHKQLFGPKLSASMRPLAIAARF